MIVYQSNKNFFKDIVHLWRSYTMIKILRGVLIMGLFSFLICLPALHFQWTDFLAIDRTIFSFLGIVLSILLVFRTNSAYDRWWEGRKQWGALVNHSRNLAIQLNITLPEDDMKSRRYFAVRISNFCFAFVEHLRGGTKLNELIELSTDDEQVYSRYKHVPNYISQEIQLKVEAAYRAGAISGYDLLNTKPHTQALLDILGACERIKKTPIPFSYAVYLKIFIVSYAVLLPFSLMQDFGFTTIPITMFVLFAFLGIELMAEEIEDPFGLDCNDLPTQTISETISQNVFEIFGISKGEVKEESETYDKIF